MTRVTQWLAVVMLCLTGMSEAVAEPYDLRISVDTGPNHLRNITIKRFIERLSERTQAIRPWLYPSSQLSKDRDIPKALHWGYVDMGVVARLKLTPFAVDMNLASSPALYGLSAKQYHLLFDGDIGQALTKKLKRLGMKVLGAPIDLGFVNVYTTEKPIKRTEDYRGLKLRVTGGSGQLELLKAFRANAVLLPFQDIPLALTQGSIDGLHTTHETAVSGKLWEFGLKYCYEDQASFTDYMPVVSQQFWNQLSPDLQALMTRTWNEVTIDGRLYAKERQAKARARIISEGISCARPSPASLYSDRLKLEPVTKRLVKKLGMDADLYQRMMRIVVSLPQEQEG